MKTKTNDEIKKLLAETKTIGDLENVAKQMSVQQIVQLKESLEVLEKFYKLPRELLCSQQYMDFELRDRASKYERGSD
jgi:hypothetical protein